MRFSISLVGLVALATLSLAAPNANFHNVINDLNALRAKAGSLEGHLHNLDWANMLQDKKDIIDGLDLVTSDARAAKSFISSEAAEVLNAARPLSQEMIHLSNEVIANKNNIPSPFHSAVSADLQTIIAHAKWAGDALVSDCPPDKKHEAGRIYADITSALDNAVKAFS
ncbi:hypothetical protein D9756_007813 [Leucocoprinus leucothites]|uniref:Uncharacterized protein n=1 Tax=Leucocoprinus leucothites TaxID=201217 RepID=A0A8H5FY67_9AGAR|nr:hypothetical protein D9756_007813 [Leucoagaricus leucothites]